MKCANCGAQCTVGHFCQQCGHKLRTQRTASSQVLRGLRIAGIVCGTILGVLIVLGAVVQHFESPEDRARRETMASEQARYEQANPQPAARSSSLSSLFSSPAVVTKSEYDQLENGISYEQARSIIGEPGEELSRSDIAGIITVMYAWKNANGSNMNAMFQNGRMISKAQFGLR